MNVHLTCTQAQYEVLTEAVHPGHSRYVEVPRQALKALLVDHTRLRKAAERAADIIEPGNHDWSPAEKKLAVRGRE